MIEGGKETGTLSAITTSSICESTNININCGINPCSISLLSALTPVDMRKENLLLK